MKVDKRIALCFALTAAFMAAAVPVHNAFIPPDKMYVGITAFEKTGQADIVITGNSHPFYGINAKVMGDVLDCEVTDFAFAGLRYGYESYYRKAEECLDEDSAVKMLIFDLDPAAFHGRPDEVHPVFPEIVRMSPRKRRFMKFCGKNFSQYSEARAAYIEDSGFFVLRDIYTPAIRNRYVSKYCRSLSRTGLNGDVFDSFLKHTEKWSKDGIKVVGLRVPDDKEATDAAFKKIAEYGLKEKFKKAGGIWVDVPGEYETMDGSHLTTESAFRYSEALAKELKKVINNNPNR